MGEAGLASLLQGLARSHGCLPPPPFLPFWEFCPGPLKLGGVWAPWHMLGCWPVTSGGKIQPNPG